MPVISVDVTMPFDVSISVDVSLVFDVATSTEFVFSLSDLSLGCFGFIMPFSSNDVLGILSVDTAPFFSLSLSPQSFEFKQMLTILN